MNREQNGLHGCESTKRPSYDLYNEPMYRVSENTRTLLFFQKLSILEKNVLDKIVWF